MSYLPLYELKIPLDECERLDFLNANGNNFSKVKLLLSKRCVSLKYFFSENNNDREDADEGISKLPPISRKGFKKLKAWWRRYRRHEDAGCYEADGERFPEPAEEEVLKEREVQRIVETNHDSTLSEGARYFMQGVIDAGVGKEIAEVANYLGMVGYLQAFLKYISQRYIETSFMPILFSASIPLTPKDFAKYFYIESSWSKNHYFQIRYYMRAALVIEAYDAQMLIQQRQLAAANESDFDSSEFNDSEYVYLEAEDSDSDGGYEPPLAKRSRVDDDKPNDLDTIPHSKQEETQSPPSLQVIKLFRRNRAVVARVKITTAEGKEQHDTLLLETSFKTHQKILVAHLQQMYEKQLKKNAEKEKKEAEEAAAAAEAEAEKEREAAVSEYSILYPLLAFPADESDDEDEGVGSDMVDLPQHCVEHRIIKSYMVDNKPFFVLISETEKPGGNVHAWAKERVSFKECRRRCPLVLADYVQALGRRATRPSRQRQLSKPRKYMSGRSMLVDDEPDELPKWWTKWVCVIDHFVCRTTTITYFIILVLKPNPVTGVRELALEKHSRERGFLCAPHLVKCYVDKLKDRADFADGAALKLYF